MPDNQYFYPQRHCQEEVEISFEEIEAIRLSDLEQLEQEAAAKRMDISRGTFQRILTEARQKIADVLIHGKALKISGGHFEVTDDFVPGYGCCRRHRHNCMHSE